MRKEILAVIIAGAFLGILVAFGIWRANNALKANITTNSNSVLTNKVSPSPVPNNGFPLTIAKPEQSDVVVEEKVVISGITKPSSWVIISDENEDYQVSSNNSGEFQQEIKLEGGVNQILVKAISENGEHTQRELGIVYSSEFAKEISK